MNRDSSLDAARGILMMLGIVLHAAAIYTVGSEEWILRSIHGSQFFDVLRDLIHTFRMPAFFLIAGYFTGLAITKYSTIELVQKRLLRLVLPTIAVLLSLNYIQRYLLSGEIHGIAEFGHLWFLVDLTICTLILMALPRIFLNALADTMPIRLVRNTALFVVFSTVYSACARFTGFGYEVFLGTTLYSLSASFPFVLYGAVLFLNDEARNRLFNVPRILFPLLVILLLWLNTFAKHDSILVRELADAVSNGATLIAIGSLIHNFRVLFKQRTWFTDFVAETSYTVFLFHHVFVVGFGLILLSIQFPPVIEFIMIVISTLLITATIHLQVVQRFPMMRLLFNGK